MKKTLELTQKQLEDLEFLLGFATHNHPYKTHRNTAKKLESILLKALLGR